MAKATTTTGTDTPPKLTERTRDFAADVRTFISKTPRTIASLSDARQLIRCSGAIGSQYIQADNAQSSRSFVTRMRNCRRDARQCQHWLRLLDMNLEERSEQMRVQLLDEAYQLDRIFSAIITKAAQKVAKEVVA